MKKYYVELQDEPKACGAYCIYMLLKHYKQHMELKTIKERCRMDMNGISMKGMLECLKSYNIEAKAYQCNLEQLSQDVKLPCILHLVIGELGHYVVLYEIKGDEYIIGDPSKGLVTMYKEELEDKFSSYMIAILHVGKIVEEREKSYLLFVKESFVVYKDDVLVFLRRGLLISFLELLGSMLFRVIIDDFDINTHYFYMILLAVLYLLVYVVKIMQERYQSTHLLQIQRVLDEEYSFDSMKNMVNMPMHSLNYEKGVIHSQLLSLSDLSEMNVMLFENVLLNGITSILFLITMAVINPILMLIVVVLLLIIGIYMKFQVPFMQRYASGYLEAYNGYHESLLEWIDSLYVLKRFCLRDRIMRYYDNFQSFVEERFYKDKKRVDLYSMVNYIVQICFFFVLLLGLWFFVNNIISLGNFVMFMMLLSSLLPLFLSFVSLFFEYHSLKIIYERYKYFRIDKEDKEKIKDTIKSIFIDDLSYSFGYRENLFSHMELLIDKNLYIKGDTGSGKSTLLSLLMGNDLRYTGHIYFNNQELRDIDLNSLYEHIGYECQSPTFFHDTIYNNLLCDDLDKIEKLLKGFGHLEIMNILELSINTDGSPLSQGQRQIIALLRLFLRDYDVYMLDEVFSHMDSKTASKIYRYIIKNYSDKLLIMVNHETKLVNRHDDYVIIDKGNLIKKGD